MKKKYEKRAPESRQDQEYFTQQSWIFMCVFLVFGVATWFTRHDMLVVFGAAFQGTLTDEMQQIKILWNVGMYIVPMTLAGLALGCFVISVVNLMMATGEAFIHRLRARKVKDSQDEC